MAHLAWIIPSVIALVGIALDHLDWASMLFSKIWQLLFVNVWYLWVTAAGYGLFRFVRLIQRFHNVTNKVLPTLMTADADTLAQAVKLIEMESMSRVSANDILSKRINSLEPQVHDHIKRGLTALQTELSGLIREEALIRKETSDAVSKRFITEVGRIAKIETSLQQVIGRIKEIDSKLAIEVATLNKRVDKTESQPLAPYKEKGLIDFISRVPTPEEAFDSGKGLLGLGLANSLRPPVPAPHELLSQAILDRKKNKKEI